jgi:hypothetical protein
MHVLNVNQALTSIVGVTLLFRYAIKVWVRCALPQVTAPGRVWGIEDFFFFVAYGLDVSHMTFIQKRLAQSHSSLYRRLTLQAQIGDSGDTSSI